ncbi:MAG: type I DNA topoisomerase, partial [Acidimicrobiales bacterium]
AKTIAGFLGQDFLVESSIGHIRDLPRNAADIPAAYKNEAWARLGVDVDNDFKPLYVVAREKKSQVSKLKALITQASEVFLATDEDREGESIAWHLLEVLAPRVPVKRMVFHEITKGAIERAVQEWRELDRRLVDAQEARRILDRLYGYEVSPVLWRKVMPRLSAGRVQSVATRVLVERERARMRFRAGSWWGIDGTFALVSDDPSAGSRVGVQGDPTSFEASLISVDGLRLATGRDFLESGEIKDASAVARLDEDSARRLASRLSDCQFAVSSVDHKPFRRSPYPPFMTSTLQQEAGRKLRFGSQRTMQVAQRLYESGYITYMRTDSTTLSDTAVEAARRQASSLYGPDYVPSSPRRYDRKVKNAQEAHEAIRPAGESFRTPDEVASEVGADEARLYDLVWKRTVASQMADAVGRSAQARLKAQLEPDPGGDGAQEVEFAASGKIITFPGFLRAYVEGADDPDAELEDREVRLPALAVGDDVDTVSLEAAGHATAPPARFTEASLVKALEEMGVGRPSTYASIIATIQDRGYVWKKGSALVPTFVAFAVVGLLEQHFGELVDYGFTAAMEDSLDDIAGGRQEAVPWLSSFYFGNGRPGLKKVVSDHLDEIDAREVNSIPIGVGSDGQAIVIRVGRYGPYVQKGDERASLAEDLCPDEVTVELAEALLAAPASDRVLGADPESGLDVWVKAGRFGPYVQLGVPEDGSKHKPRTSSLFKTMSPETVTLAQALDLLSLPRVLGPDADGEEVQVLNGRFGPYVKKGSESRSLESEDQLFSLTLPEALVILAQPKARRGRGAAAPPLKELGPDPVSGGPMVVKDGRFGPYVTDGELNASLRKGDSVEELTPSRAAELLADRRAAGPPVKRAKKAAGAKKATAKKATAKKVAAKKTGMKKVAAKKATGSIKAATNGRNA